MKHCVEHIISFFQGYMIGLVHHGKEHVKETGCMANSHSNINVETAGICTVEMEMRSGIG